MIWNFTANPGYVFAILTTFCWTISALAFEIASKRVGSVAVNLLRLLIALALLGFITLHRTGHFIPPGVSDHQWRWLLLSGFVGFFVGDMALFRAYVLIGSRLTTLLMVLAAPFGAVCGYFMIGETLTPLKIIGMVIALGGVAWVCAERRENDATPHHHVLIGVMLGIIAAFGQGLGAVLTKIGTQGLNAFEVTQIRVLAGVAGFIIAIPMMRQTGNVILATRNPRAMVFLTIGAIAGPVLGVSSYNYAITKIPVGIAGTLAAMVPVVIIPFVILVKKETVSIRAIVGAIVAVAGAVLLCI